MEVQEPEAKPRPPTRRLRVFSPENYWTDTHIMLMSPDSSFSAEPSFLARKVSPSTIDPEMLKNWLRLCRENHSCQSGDSSQESLDFSHCLRFIDLEQEALVSCAETGTVVPEYATLSYVWGRAQKLLLRRHNFESFRSSGALSPRIPEMEATIRDAMQLVRSIGIRYIWIDALCIIQDCYNDKSRTIPVMDQIYGNAAVNICAASGTSVRNGIEGSPMTPRNLAHLPIATCAGLTLMATKTVESRIQNTRWNSRAWVFQERVLSKRSLIFVEDCVFFQCHQATWSEEVCSASSIPAWTLEMVSSPFNSIAKNPVRLYLEYVELYSVRQMASKSDRINGFMGVLAMLKPLLGTTFFFGLPSSYFDLAVLWETKNDETEIDWNRMSEFPSWPWCGWIGGCTWRLSTISGVLLDLHDWLVSHTWVVWYKLKPDDTDFQLVWSSVDSPRASMSSRWRGYQTSSNSDEPYGRRQVLENSEPKPTFPTSPHRDKSYLYFWTYTAFFQLSRETRTSPTFATKLEPGLHRFSLLDSNGDWCGTIILEDKWFTCVGDVLEFAAISDARDFSMEELDTWNYYVPEDREVSEWQLYYALLIVWGEEYEVAERAGLAKIYQRAYDFASFDPGKAWREITLG
ncbi:heterokaryon incompatibility protein [Colletotrichum chrysophilum]|uniref:Heterokaryon incompatibility protein n=2 Tax=Colletotrichum chrysophilum TaxID=1836956 RepID=A0AAD9EFC3_9PEZI|nr:heterokaryon incompatibility protein [Colletotrichum chrysophilum]